MQWIEITFWFALALIFYTYLGYGILLYALVQIKRLFPKKSPESIDSDFFPEVSFIVAAYNEQDFIEQKVRNSLALNYPREKIRFMFVTDGSNDKTPEILATHPQIELFHQPERKGKIAAIERVMKSVETPIVIFSDANTELNSEAILEIVKHYKNPKVGGVAGEKRIYQSEEAQASEAGEGLYWKYESFLKRMDSEFSSVMGAAGELFSIRSKLFRSVEKDTILDDFLISFEIIRQGYTMVYEPNAFAQESSSASIKEEFKRKIRISAGGIQSVLRLSDLFNPFHYGWISFQFISHRVLRWTLTPLALVWVLLGNIVLAFGGGEMYLPMLLIQLTFYAAAMVGWVLENKKIKIKAFFIPFYFLMMNYSVYRGFLRLMKGRQSVLWEKAKRAEWTVSNANK